MPAGIRHTSTFEAETGETFTIQIWDKTGSAGASEFDTKRGGFAISHAGDSSGGGGDYEIFPPIFGTQCSVQLYAVSGTEDGIIPDLISSEEGRFLVRILRNSTVEWIGYVLPDIGSVEEAPYPYLITLKATDGLGALAAKKYWDELTEEPFAGKETWIGHICRALRKLPYVDTFYDADDFFVRSAVDWWEAGMNNDPEGPDALGLAAADHSVWYRWEKGEKNYESCLSVITSILVKLRARITMYQGAFFIEQRSYRTAETVVLRRYTKNGVFVSTINFSGTKTIDQSEANGALIAGAVYEFAPALLEHRHIFKTFTRRNFLDGAKPQTHLYNDAETFTRPIESNNGKASLRFTANIRVTISSTTYNPSGTNPLKPFALVFRLYVKLKTVGISRDYTLLPSYQVQYGQPYWSNPPVTSIVFPVLGSAITANLTGDKYTFTQTVDLYSAKLPESTDEYTFFWDFWEIRKFEGGTYPKTHFNVEYDLVNPWLEAYSDGGPVVGQDEIAWDCLNTGFPKNSIRTENSSLLGTSIDPNVLGAIWVKDGPFSYALGAGWADGEDPVEEDDLESLLCELTVSAQATPLRKLVGTIFADNIRSMFRLRWLETDWLLASGTWTGSTNEFSGEWIEMKYLPGLDTSPPKRRTNPTSEGVLPPHGIYNNNGGGERYGLAERPPGTLFYPVAITTTPHDYMPGAVTSIDVSGVLAKTNVYADDTVVIMDPVTGNWDELLVTADSEDGDTAIAVTGTLTGYYHQNAPVIKKPVIGRFDLVAALNKFPEYVSDEAAVAAGLAVGDWYVTADGHVSVASGVLKKVRAIS